MARAPAKFEVLLTKGAEQELEAIHVYISEFDCVANPNYVLDELMQVEISTLAKMATQSLAAWHRKRSAIQIRR